MQQEEPIFFKTKMAESIYYLIKNKNKPKTRYTELFQPGRMMYEWKWVQENGQWSVEDYVPQCVLRSKQEVRSYEMVRLLVDYDSSILIV